MNKFRAIIKIKIQQKTKALNKLKNLKMSFYKQVLLKSSYQFKMINKKTKILIYKIPLKSLIKCICILSMKQTKQALFKKIKNNHKKKKNYHKAQCFNKMIFFKNILFTQENIKKFKKKLIFYLRTL